MGTRRDRPNDPVQPYQTSHKCSRHNAWKRKNKYHPELGAVCELCRMEIDNIKKESEIAGGSNKPPVKIIKL